MEYFWNYHISCRGLADISMFSVKAKQSKGYCNGGLVEISFSYKIEKYKNVMVYSIRHKTWLQAKFF